ncbi:MAG: 16S rRNA (cytosine(1402)-N(4))-methyltransferase RsmH [Stellaceae bacterium]
MKGRQANPETGPGGHVPVLLDAVIEALALRDGAAYVDGTFGAGGYSIALLAAASCRVFAIDRDPDAVRAGAALALHHAGRLAVIEGRFSEMARLLAPLSPPPIAGVALDLGVSSTQLDTPERGFSFRLDGPLDMRMGQRGQTAADLVESLSEPDLAALIGEFGEERFARRVARAIVAARRQRAIRRTLELAEIVRAAMPKSEPGLDPATRTFQALRIAVNDELGVLEKGLLGAWSILACGGRIVVVTFHSIEDRLAKEFFAKKAASGEGRLLMKKPLPPSREEVVTNPRSRSAKLRAIEKLC